MEKVAILGLGIVGSRVRHLLIDAGYSVSCWSRTRRGLAGERESPGEAVADTELVSLYLKDVPMVREVFAKVVKGLKPGATVMNHSTIDVPTTLWLGEQCADRGCAFLDAPFTGSKDAAAAGQLLYYTGGDRELVEDLADYLAVSSKGRIHCGGVGAATVTKLGTNLISACTVQAMSEALAIAVKYRVKAEVFIKAAIRNGSGSPLMAMKYPRMLAGDFDPHFTLANMWKDSLYALALAESEGLEVPAISAVSARMGEMCGKSFADDDFSALVRAYEI